MIYNSCMHARTQSTSSRPASIQEGGKGMRHEKYIPTPSVAKSVVDGLQSGNNLLERRSVSWYITPTFLDQTVKRSNGAKKLLVRVAISTNHCK